MSTLLVSAVPLPLAATASRVAHAPVKQSPVEMQVVDVNPSAPTATTKPAPLRITIKLTNTTAAPLPKIEIRAERGDPIGTQTALDASLAAKAPADTGLSVKPDRPVTVAIAANDSTTTTFATTTSLVEGKGLCLCDNEVYPLVLSAHIIGAGGADERLGAVTTYVSSNYKPLAHPVRVSWVWPLIDRPHRLVDDAVFTDDDLAVSVASGGRLDRALQVVEQAAQAPISAPLTLVVDPELLDELEVMANAPYTIQAPGSPLARAGTGRDAATSWLARFATVLNTHPSVVDISLTPYADPDVTTLSDSGLGWSTILPVPMNQRVAQALSGRTVQSRLAWPPSDAVDQRTLDSLGRAGVGTVVLNSASVNPSSVAGIPSTLTRLRTRGTFIAAALTSPALQFLVKHAIVFDGSAALPALTAEVLVRAIQDPTLSRSAVLTPPRYVDPDVAAAVRMIRETSTSPFAVATALSAVTSNPVPSTSRLRAVPATRAKLPRKLITTTDRLTDAMPVLRELFADGLAARPLLAALPHAIQRLSSAAWRVGAEPFGPALGLTFARQLDTRTQALLGGVHIVKPSSGSYTLASSTARLPITVENTLSYPAFVRVAVTTQNGVPGYTQRAMTPVMIPPHNKLIVQVPSRVERSGRIPVEAQLQTGSGVPLGSPVRLFVHSTIFGVIGILITVVAGGVLALALILRVGRRVRSRRKMRTTVPPQTLKDAAAVEGSAP